MTAAEPQQHTLPIDFAPPVVREHGLVEAHTAPLVGVRLDDDDVRSLGRRSPEEAWGYPLLEWSRSGRATTVLALDGDSDKSISVLQDALRDVDAPLPRPNVLIERKRSGHVLACWCLETPVGRGPHARRAPLSFLGSRVGVLLGRGGRRSGVRVRAVREPGAQRLPSVLGGARIPTACAISGPSCRAAGGRRRSIAVDPRAGGTRRCSCSVAGSRATCRGPMRRSRGGYAART